MGWFGDERRVRILETEVENLKRVIASDDRCAELMKLVDEHGTALEKVKYLEAAAVRDGEARKAEQETARRTIAQIQGEKQRIQVSFAEAQDEVIALRRELSEIKAQVREFPVVVERARDLARGFAYFVHGRDLDGFDGAAGGDDDE